MLCHLSFVVLINMIYFEFVLYLSPDEPTSFIFSLLCFFQTIAFVISIVRLVKSSFPLHFYLDVFLISCCSAKPLVCHLIEQFPHLLIWSVRVCWFVYQWKSKCMPMFYSTLSSLYIHLKILTTNKIMRKTKYIILSCPKSAAFVQHVSDNRKSDSASI